MFRYADAYQFSFSHSSTKAGFGLGALNEAEDDDIDVYDSTTRADRTYMPYDAIRDADDGSSVNRGKLVQRVESSFFFYQVSRLIIARLLRCSSGSRTEQPY
jgi:hypothetical protein